MSNNIKVGNLAVASHVATIYGYYLQDAIAAMVVQDYRDGNAVDAEFQNILPEPHRVVIYQHFVGVFSETEPGVIGSAFFVPREEAVPTSVLERLLEPLPENHVLSREAARTGGLGRLRDRLLDALQHGGLRRVGTEFPRNFRYYWLATQVALDLEFDVSDKTFSVVNAWSCPQ